MKSPLVSIIIPSFNHESFLEESLKSLAAQTYRPLEIVIVDDGSTDNSPRIIRKFAKKFSRGDLKVRFFLRESQGAHAALNFGIRKAKGSLIAINNSDDIFHPSRLEILTRPMRSGHAEMSLSTVQFIDENSRQIRKADPRVRWYFDQLGKRKGSLSTSFAQFLFPLHVSSSNFVFTKKLFQRIGGFRNYRWAHDYDFFLRASLWTEPMFFSASLLDYRKHSSNTMTSSKENQEMYHQECRRVLEDFLEEAGFQFLGKKPRNRFAPTPYNWLLFKKLYAQGRVYFSGSKFLSELSLCHRQLASKKDVSGYLQKFLWLPDSAAAALEVRQDLKLRYQDSFLNFKDARVRELKIRSLRKVFYKGRSLGCMISVGARISLPYNERLALLAVFSKNRLQAVLRYEQTQEGTRIFRGFTRQDFSKRKSDLQICWLDFSGDQMVCRWPGTDKAHHASIAFSKPQEKLKIR